MLVVLASLLLVGSVAAQTSPGYDLSWHVVATGGREGATSGTHIMHGTLGQLAIGPAGATHAVGAGYWYGLGQRLHGLYLPLIIKGDPAP
jgi:hypothetical protein